MKVLSGNGIGFENIKYLSNIIEENYEILIKMFENKKYLYQGYLMDYGKYKNADFCKVKYTQKFIFNNSLSLNIGFFFFMLCDFR